MRKDTNTRLRTCTHTHARSKYNLQITDGPYQSLPAGFARCKYWGGNPAWERGGHNMGQDKHQMVDVYLCVCVREEILSMLKHWHRDYGSLFLMCHRWTCSVMFSTLNAGGWYLSHETSFFFPTLQTVHMMYKREGLWTSISRSCSPVPGVTLYSLRAVRKCDCKCFDFQPWYPCGVWWVISDSQGGSKKKAMQTRKEKKGKPCCHMNKASFNSLTCRGYKPIKLASYDTVCRSGDHFLAHIPFHFTSSPPSSTTPVSYILFVLAIISSPCTSLASWRLMNSLSLWIQWLFW